MKNVYWCKQDNFIEQIKNKFQVRVFVQMVKYITP